jgi:SpoVK/Ycf46/Vps4 family AAA+-type ATPase
VLHRYLGEGEAMLRQVFKQARLSAPSIIFLDELDALFSSRAASTLESSATQLLSTLLIEMDGLELATGAWGN